MATSTDVTLYRDAEPTFPDVCVVCLGKPERYVSFVNARTASVWSFLVPLMGLFSWARSRVPACRTCARTFRLQRWGRAMLFLLVILIAIPVVQNLTADIEVRALQRLAVAGLVLVAAVPVVLVELFRPRYVDTKPGKETVTWEFASARYADAFRRLNRDGLVAKERAQLLSEEHAATDGTSDPAG